MENILVRNIRHTCRNRLLVAVPLVIVGILLDGWLFSGGLLAAFFQRAIPVDRQTLNVDALGNRESFWGLHFPLQTVSLTIPAGNYDDTGWSYTNGEAATADYYMITTQGDSRLLLIIVDYETHQTLADAPTHTFAGSLRLPSPDMLEFLKKQCEQAGVDYSTWIQNITAYELDTTRSGAPYGLLLLALAIAGTAGGAFLLWTGLRPMLDPHSHRVFRQLQQWGEAEEAPTCIQQEVDDASAGYYPYRRQYLMLTSRWLLQGNAFAFRIFRSSDILWAYNTRNIQSFDDVPSDRSHVNLCFAGKHLRCQMRIDLCKKLLEDMTSRYPDAIYGYSKERASAWRANPATFNQTMRKSAPG